MDIVPDIAGSTIAGSLSVSGTLLNYEGAKATETTTQENLDYTELINSVETVTANLVSGQGYTTLSTDVDYSKATITYTE